MAAGPRLQGALRERGSEGLVSQERDSTGEDTEHSCLPYLPILDAPALEKVPPGAPCGTAGTRLWPVVSP